MKKLNLSKKKKIITAVVLVLVIAGVAVVRGIAGGSAVAMTDATAVKQDLTKYYSFSGNIESSDVQNVVATSSEPVKKFYVQEGDKVQVGDLLYEVDSNTIQSTLTSANTNLANAKTTYAADKLDYERKKSLYDLGGVTLEELQSAQDSLSAAKNQVTEAQASYEQAQKQYDDTKCYAEVTGEVSEIYVDENDSITQGTSIMDIVNYDSLEISIKVDEYDLSEITEGMDAEVSLEAIGKTVTGTISEIARGASVDNGVSYFDTTVSLPQDSDLRVGLSAEVKVVTASAKDAVTVPVSAVTYNGAKAYVQQYNDSGSLENTEVTVGINNGTDIEIKSGLEEGDKIAYVNTSTSDSSQMAGGPMGGGAPPQGGDQGGGSGDSGSGAPQ
jgi:RND family efflux transporter MFP subunit